MSAGRILTLGLGTPFSDVGFLVTLGLGTNAVPPTPSTDVAGGAGRPVYRRRKWRETKQLIEDGLREAYEELIEAKLPPAVTKEAVKAVKPFADKAARFKSVPKASEIDFRAMERDAAQARHLIAIHSQHVAQAAWNRLLDDEDEILLLN